MDYGSLVGLTGAMPCFDLALLVQAFDDRREVIRVQLSRWMKQGKVVGLRRGMYTLSDTYRRAADAGRLGERAVPAVLPQRTLGARLA